MHASTMTKDELDALQRQVFDFFQTRKTERVPVAEATKHFESLGHTITRPIEDTLQVYGMVERPEDADPRQRWPFPQMEGAWVLEDDVLVPRVR